MPGSDITSQKDNHHNTKETLAPLHYGVSNHTGQNCDNGTTEPRLGFYTGPFQGTPPPPLIRTQLPAHVRS